MNLKWLDSFREDDILFGLEQLQNITEEAFKAVSERVSRLEDRVTGARLELNAINRKLDNAKMYSGITIKCPSRLSLTSTPKLVITGTNQYPVICKRPRGVAVEMNECDLSRADQLVNIPPCDQLLLSYELGIRDALAGLDFLSNYAQELEEALEEAQHDKRAEPESVLLDEDIEYFGDRENVGYKPKIEHVPQLNLPDNLDLPGVASIPLKKSESTTSVLSTPFTATSAIAFNGGALETVPHVPAVPPPPPPPPPSTPMPPKQASSSESVAQAPKPPQAQLPALNSSRNALLEQIRQSGGKSILKNNKTRKMKQKPAQVAEKSPAPDIMSALTQALALRRKGMLENREDIRNRTMSQETDEWHD